MFYFLLKTFLCIFCMMPFTKTHPPWETNLAIGDKRKGHKNPIYLSSFFLSACPSILLFLLSFSLPLNYSKFIPLQAEPGLLVSNSKYFTHPYTQSTWCLWLMRESKLYTQFILIPKPKPSKIGWQVYNSNICHQFLQYFIL